MNGWGGEVTLRTVIRHAAEIIHPKSHVGTYPVLGDYPQMRRLALALVQADQAHESTAVLQEIALELVDLLKHIRDAQQANWRGKPTTGKAQDVLTKPEAIREREADLRALRKKVLTAAPKPPPMPGLFGDVRPAPPAATRSPASPAPFISRRS